MAVSPVLPQLVRPDERRRCCHRPKTDPLGVQRKTDPDILLALPKFLAGNEQGGHYGNVENSTDAHLTHVFAYGGNPIVEGLQLAATRLDCYIATQAH